MDILEEIVNNNLNLIYCNDPNPVKAIEFMSEYEGIYIGIHEVISIMENEDLIEPDGITDYYFLTTQGYEVYEQGGWINSRYFDFFPNVDPDPIHLPKNDKTNKKATGVILWLCWVVVGSLFFCFTNIVHNKQKQRKDKKQKCSRRLSKTFQSIPYQNMIHFQPLLLLTRKVCKTSSIALSLSLFPPQF